MIENYSVQEFSWINEDLLKDNPEITSAEAEGQDEFGGHRVARPIEREKEGAA